MKLGTIVFDNEIYNLDYMTAEELKKLLNKTKQNKRKDLNEINLSAKLNYLYAIKKSEEIVNTKLNNQLNSMKISIDRINSKFANKSKKYEEINEKMEEVLDEYELVLKVYCDKFDETMKELILKRSELEARLLMANLQKEYLYNQEKKHIENNILIHSISVVAKKIKARYTKRQPVDVSLINKINDEKDINKEFSEKEQFSEEYKDNQQYIYRLENEVRKLNKRIDKIDNEKENRIFSALEVGNKEISTEIRKPHTLKKIKRFFINKFNTYNVIIKTVIEPVKIRVDEFKVNELDSAVLEEREIILEEIEDEIKERTCIGGRTSHYKK